MSISFPFLVHVFNLCFESLKPSSSVNVQALDYRTDLLKMDNQLPKDPIKQTSEVFRSTYQKTPKRTTASHAIDPLSSILLALSVVRYPLTLLIRVSKVWSGEYNGHPLQLIYQPPSCFPLNLQSRWRDSHWQPKPYRPTDRTSPYAKQRTYSSRIRRTKGRLLGLIVGCTVAGIFFITILSIITVVHMRQRRRQSSAVQRAEVDEGVVKVSSVLP